MTLKTPRSLLCIYLYMYIYNCIYMYIYIYIIYLYIHKYIIIILILILNGNKRSCILQETEVFNCGFIVAFTSTQSVNNFCILTLCVFQILMCVFCCYCCSCVVYMHRLLSFLWMYTVKHADKWFAMKHNYIHLFSYYFHVIFIVHFPIRDYYKVKMMLP